MVCQFLNKLLRWEYYRMLKKVVNNIFKNFWTKYIKVLGVIFMVCREKVEKYDELSISN